MHTCTWYLELQRDLYLLPSPQVTAALDTGTSFIAWFQVYEKTVTGWYGWSMSGIVLSKLQRDYNSPLEESLFIKQCLCIYIHSVMQPHQCSSLKLFRGSFVTGLDQSVLLVDESYVTFSVALVLWDHSSRWLSASGKSHVWPAQLGVEVLRFDPLIKSSDLGLKDSCAVDNTELLAA